ncbi:MAG: helix-turn-helix transcriptional regulator [Terrimicrobiaceae bacterium]
MATIDKMMDIFYHFIMSPRPLPGFISRRVLRGRYLFLNLDPPASTELAVTCAGWEECDPEYEIQRDDFRYLALEYIVGGIWELKTRGGKAQIGPGAIFTYGPGTSYSLRALPGGGHSKYFVDFAGHAAAKLIARTGLKGARAECIVHRRWLHDLLEQLIETAQLRPSARASISRMLAPLILERIRTDLRPAPRSSHAQQTYERCRRYLSDHYVRVRNLSEAAGACGVSAVHLSRLFHRFATECPNAFLTRLKMNHAAELIVRGNVSVKAAAQAVGYEDPYHFSRVFKRVHGVAPSLFGK